MKVPVPSSCEFLSSFYVLKILSGGSLDGIGAALIQLSKYMPVAGVLTVFTEREDAFAWSIWPPVTTL